MASVEKNSNKHTIQLKPSSLSSVITNTSNTNTNNASLSANANPSVVRPTSPISSSGLTFLEKVDLAIAEFDGQLPTSSSKAALKKKGSSATLENLLETTSTDSGENSDIDFADNLLKYDNDFVGGYSSGISSGSAPSSAVGTAISFTIADNDNIKDRSHSLSLAGNMFSEVFESKANDIDSGALEDVTNSMMVDNDKFCKICNSRLNAPRVLSCLHVFCESCLTKLLNENGGVDAGAVNGVIVGGGITDTQCQKSMIICPTCKQETKVGASGIESLTCDYILTNILDLSSIESEQMSCTSCKSKEKAISRCNDCANFLCGGCDNAHKYMRCFENHEVVKLEDLQNANNRDKPFTVHKPLFCNIHASEHLKYYCFNCQMTVCNDCLIADHKGSDHHYDVVNAADQTVRKDVENLMKEAKSKVQYCDTSAANLTCALNELQTQHDTARDLIGETYKGILKIVEKCRDQMLTDLGKLHSERELKIMDVLQNIETMTARIEDTCNFADRVLEKANAVEFLTMKKLIATQFMNLINNTPKCDINYSLYFDTNIEKFDLTIREAFGKFRTESSPPSPKESTPPPTLPGVAPTCDNLNNSGNSHGPLTSSVTASSPISMPASMQSSFEGDLSVLGTNGFNMPNPLTPDAQSQHQHLLNAHIQQQQQQQQQPQHQGVSQHVNHSFNGLGGGNGGSNLSSLLANNGNTNLNSTANSILNGSSLGNALNNASMNQTLNSTLSSLNSTITANGVGGVNLNGGLNVAGLNGSLNGGMNGNVNGVPGNFSFLEYNLSRLASLNESTADTLNDTLVVNGGTGSGNVNHQSVVPSGPNTSIILADIISGDQRALNNLQALAKLGLNNNVDFQTDLSLLSNLSSPKDLYSDFGLSSSNPLNNLSPMVNVDDISLANFHAGASPNVTNIITGRNKATAMQIRCKFGSLGTSKGQFNSPHGFCLGVDEEIIVADTNNHRIEVFDKAGTLKFQFGVPGKEEGQLWYPRKVAVMHTNGKFVVCDRGNERSRMQIFSKCGHFMRKIAIRYIDIVAGLAVTAKGHIVAVDSVSPTVFVISEDGELVRWFDCSDYMREPSDIAIRDNDFYVCDFKGHCVAVFQEDGTFQYRIGNEKVTCFPNGIDISNAGDILIGDSHGNRFHVACYSRDGILQSEFECPHVKVSRCCGLKITSEGYVVTLAKNNHHVLVLNTLYVH